MKPERLRFFVVLRGSSQAEDLRSSLVYIITNKFFFCFLSIAPSPTGESSRDNTCFFSFIELFPASVDPMLK